MTREIDDINKRKKYKKEQFGNKKSRTDDYTGQKVFSGNSKDLKHRHPSNKTSDTDHITPLKVVEERYKNLSKQQQQTLANNPHNYATVNSKMNRSKGDLENHQYLHRQRKKGEAENLKTSARMLNKEIESRTVMRAEATVMYVQNTVENTKDLISEQTERFMSENFKAIHAAGVDEAVNSALFVAIFSTVKNIHSVIKGEESGKEAIKEILFDTSSAAALGYATGAVMEKFNIGEQGDAALLVNGTIQISKQVFAYVNGDIDEQQLLNNVAETTVHLAAAYVGRMIGAQLIPIPYVGPYIGEMITTAICSEVISTIKDTKEFKKQNQKYISLYRKAEQEIRLSNERLTAIIESENNELKKILQDGFIEIHNGINENSYDTIMNGLAIIGSKFGMKDEDFKKNLVTRENLFKNTDKTRIIGKEG